MGDTVQISGQLTAGPSSASDGGFPAGVSNLPLTLMPSARPYNVSTGAMLRTMATSVGVYATLDGVPNTVSQATFIYFRCTGVMLLRITRAEPTLSDVVEVIPIQGLFMLELDPSRYAKLLEVSGSGQIEYFVSGTQ